MKLSKIGIALAGAAALAVVGCQGHHGSGNHSSEAKVKCEGGNACKGHSDCATSNSACKGQNACKGHGWTMTTLSECKAAGGTASS